MASFVDRLKSLVPAGSSLGAELCAWLRQNSYWYVTSAVVHAIGFVVFAIMVTFLPGIVASTFNMGRAPTFDPVDEVHATEMMPERFVIGDAPLENTRLDLETLGWGAAAPQEAKYYDESEKFEDAGGGTNLELPGKVVGGLGGFRVDDLAGIGGLGGVGVSSGEGDNAGIGGAGGQGFGGRGRGHRKALNGVTGGTSASDRAVAGGLHWLARHQLPAGQWTLQHNKGCSGRGCGGQGSVKADVAATSMALLSFLGAGQTHKLTGPYKTHVSRGLNWLIKRQALDGDLSADCPEQRMYVHGLATLALCEAYGMSQDPVIGEAASKAIRFIEKAQNETTGGWRYQPGDPGDTSVTGWQVMALKRRRWRGWASIRSAWRTRASGWPPWPRASTRGSSFTSPMIIKEWARR